MSSCFFLFCSQNFFEIFSGFDRRRYCAAGAGALPYLVGGNFIEFVEEKYGDMTCTEYFEI